MRLLLKYDWSIEELGVDESFVYKLYEDYEEMGGHFDPDYYGDNWDINMLEHFLLDESFTIAKNSALVLSHIQPKLYLENVPKIAKFYPPGSQEILSGLISEPCRYILNRLNDNYFGSMCPGWLDNIEKGDQEIISEYQEQRILWSPVLRIISPDTKLYKQIIDILRDLAECAAIDDSNEDFSENNPNQLKLDL